MLNIHKGTLCTGGMDVGITQSRLSTGMGLTFSWPHGACYMA